MKNPYEILGVKASATPDDIRKAYRKLAKTYHPDLHPGDAKAEARFKEISSANALLSDPEKRARFDAGEIDAAGNERPPTSFYRPHADAGDGAKYARYDGSGDAEAMSDIFADLFRRGRGGGGNLKIRGADINYALDVPFIDAARGTKTRATMADGKVLDITIPEGVRDRQTLRLRGKGMEGIGGGPPGDAYIDIHVLPHPFFTRQGFNIHMTLPITLGEAVSGGKITVPTITGPVDMSVPKHSNTGSTMRLKNRGILNPKTGERGHQYVRLEIVLPEEPDPELDAFAKSWRTKNPYDPRREILEAT